MSYVDKSYTAVSQAMADIRSGLLSEHATERMVKADEVWLGYYRHAIEIHEHRIEGNRIDSTESIVELALDDMKSGKVGVIATSRYVDWDHDWTKRYEAALDFHGHERFRGAIYETSSGFWSFVFNRKAGGS